MAVSSSAVILDPRMIDNALSTVESDIQATRQHLRATLSNTELELRASRRARQQHLQERPKTTAKNYDPKQKEFQDWCKLCKYPDDAVTEGKLLLFLDEAVASRPLRGNNAAAKRKRGSNYTTAPRKFTRIASEAIPISGHEDEAMEVSDDDQSFDTLTYGTVRGYKTALVDLWTQQQQDPTYKKCEHPGQGAVAHLLSSLRLKQHKHKKANYVDRGKHAANDSYNAAQLKQICQGFWREGAIATKQAKGAHNRALADFLIGHHCLDRGEHRREIELCDLQLTRTETETQSASTVILTVVSGNSKVNRNNRIETSGALRAKDIDICLFSALACYLVWRWHKSGEKFPIFRTSPDWYDTKLFIGTHGMFYFFIIWFLLAIADHNL